MKKPLPYPILYRQGALPYFERRNRICVFRHGKRGVVLLVSVFRLKFESAKLVSESFGIELSRHWTNREFTGPQASSPILASFPVKEKFRAQKLAVKGKPPSESLRVTLQPSR